MKFTKIELFDWLKPQPHDLIDLSGSGISGPKTLGELGLDLGDMPIFGYNYYGWPPLKERLAELFKVHPDDIALTPGASMANFAAMAATLDTGDKALLERPFYQPFVSLAETLTGQTPLFIERRFEDKYKLDGQLWSRHIDHIKLLIATNLHNPGGVFTQPDALVNLADRVSSAGGWLLVDEIFTPFIAGEEWNTVARLHNRIIATGSLTKVWGLSGLRIGWVVAPPPVARAVERVMDYLHVNQPFITDYITLKYLENETLWRRWLNYARTRASENWLMVNAFLERTPQLEYVKPDGGIIVFVRFCDRCPSQTFTDHVLKEHKVLVQPGRFFGDASGFRIGFGGDPVILAQGLRLIERELKASSTEIHTPQD
ncbi:MAG: pyridoxal phosphate-dependent aminotransferase [Calditrichaeota bacterium]|nr:pyridoxal phosphate-dependent aminotransferase [Calditrichota bacterium]